MAGYTNKYSGNANKSNTAAAAPAKQTRKTEDEVFSTGLFAGKPGSPMVASVLIKEDVTIPAGSYINLFQNEPGKKTSTGKDAPPFRLSVRAANK